MHSLARHSMQVLAAVLVHGAVPASLSAQEATRPPPQAQQQQGQRQREAGAEQRRAAAPVVDNKLPADQASEHTLALPGRTLRFEAVAGSIALRNASGELQAEIAYVSYALRGVDIRTRPVTFALNGGPGSASAWLHIGTLGPWRLPLDGAAASPSAPPLLVANAETWLDFTDLVLIDPAGTGYSRVERRREGSGDGGRGGGGGAGQGHPPAWTVEGDIRSLSDFIEKWVAKAGRAASPKVLLGESYAGFRVPRMAYQLQTQHGIGVHAIVMVSPVLDFGLLRGGRNFPVGYVALLPSLAAAAMEAAGRTVTPEAMREVEAYARGEFLADLARGLNDKAAVARVVERVAALTGLARDVVEQHAGRIDGNIYRREANRRAGRVASPYDASVTGLDPDPTSAFARGDDPFAAALKAPVATAMRDLYAARLGWRIEASYALSSSEVNGGWQWGNSSAPVEAMSQLKWSLALDQRLLALVVHGYTDLVTPYFASSLLIDQVSDRGGKGRLRQITYPGGHMFYSRDAPRARFREDGRRLIAERLANGG